MNRTIGWSVAALVALLLAASVYVIDAREVAVVTFFGAPVRNVLEPGLYVRAPWPLHRVVRFDRRSRLLVVDQTEILTKDKKNLVLEAFVVWRVASPQRFLESVGTDDTAEARLTDLVVSRIASGLGRRDYGELLAVREEGEEVPSLLPDGVLQDLSTVTLERYGVELQDVRIDHLGLPSQNEQSIYERMRAERARIANAYRSEGEEQATGIRAKADREAAELLATAQRDAGAITAKAEGTAARLHADAYKSAPDFYRFLRGLDTYRNIVDDDTVLVLDADSPLLQGLTEGPR